MPVHVVPIEDDALVRGRGDVASHVIVHDVSVERDVVVAEICTALPQIETSRGHATSETDREAYAPS